MMEPSFFNLLSAEEQIDFSRSIESHSPRAIRLRPNVAPDQLPFETIAVPWYPLGRTVVDHNLRPSQFLEYPAGQYYIQEAGSLLALALLNVQPGEAVCDLCAAPGGKASGILERLGSGGFLLANETIRSRVDILRFMLSRVGSLRYAVTQSDPDMLVSNLAGSFDALLVDAPCSGQAMVMSGKRDRNGFDPKQIAHSAERQRRILRAAVRLLRPGGRLIYSTCTFAIEENESQIRWLHEEYPSVWEPIIAPELAAWSSSIEPGCYRLWPHRHATSGAFAAGLRLVGALAGLDREPEGPSGRSARHAKRGRTSDWQIVGADKSGIELFGEFREAKVAVHADGFRRGVSADAPERLALGVPPSAWPELADFRGKRAIPHHGLSLLGKPWFEPLESLELKGPQARIYLAGQSFPVQDSENLRSHSGGWRTVQWLQNRLGWAKLAGIRYNNHLTSAGYWGG
jgi:16S rRNA C967 or C1407 C5-methylase (RsmB/RsmF family)